MIDLLIYMQKLIIYGQVIDNGLLKSILDRFNNGSKGLSRSKREVKYRKTASQGFAY